MQIQNRISGREKALLVGVDRRSEENWDLESCLEELAQLTDTAGAVVVGQLTAKLFKPHPATFIGKGKCEELALMAKTLEADVIIFDDELSPAQVRNLYNICQIRIIDRTQLILDIFARRAKTKESQLQVELAQLKYLLPRLTRQWLHLSRQDGGIGSRGPGETQLEVDRRRVKTRIMRLSNELKEVVTERDVQRKKRAKADLPMVSILGYTNAGKTTLFNRITSSSNLAEDRLFATLDATVRKIEVEGSMPILISDTVGFIRKLPHHLVESFKSTLEEITHSDLLIHVIDVTDPLAEEKFKVVLEIVRELGAEKVSIITAVNKIDALDGPESIHHWSALKEKMVPISAKLGQGVERLLSEIVKILKERYQKLQVFIPHSETKWISVLYREGHVLSQRSDEKGTYLEVELPSHLISKIQNFSVQGN